MKKLTIAVGLLLGSITANAQTEYVELSQNPFVLEKEKHFIGSKLFNKSFMMLYNGDASYDDLEVLSINGNKKVHYVVYSGRYPINVVVICSDEEGSKREICVGGECNEYDTHTTRYEFTLKEKTKFTFSNTL